MHTREKCRFIFEQSKTLLESDFHVNPLSSKLISFQNPVCHCSVPSAHFFFAAVVGAFLVKVLDVVSAT